MYKRQVYDFILCSICPVSLSKAGLCYNAEKNAIEEDVYKRQCMRGCDMTGCNIKGANLFAAVLEHAVLDDIVSDENTQWFRMHCPETGPILGYKKCVNDRLVQLLIPADAKRTSATLPSCRCNKAKVLTIKSFDSTEEFDEAWSCLLYTSRCV